MKMSHVPKFLKVTKAIHTRISFYSLFHFEVDYSNSTFIKTSLDIIVIFVNFKVTKPQNAAYEHTGILTRYLMYIMEVLLKKLYIYQ